MYEATIKIMLPDNIDGREAALDYVAENIPLTGDYSVNVGVHDSDPKMSLVWYASDIIDRAKYRDIVLTEEQAAEILGIAEKRHDCNIGINWEVLDCHTDWFLQELEKEDG